MLIIKDATEKQLANWDCFVENSINGTLFHKRKFLNYHQDKFFNKEQFKVITKGDDVIAQFCYLRDIDTAGRTVALSPYGASLGGIILKKIPSYLQSKNIVSTLIKHLNDENIDYCRITLPPSICSALPLDVFMFSFLESGFKISNMDISSVVNLSIDAVEYSISSRARNNFRQARKKSDIIIKHRSHITDFMETLEETYAQHGVDPTHSYEDLLYLTKNLSEDIFVDVAYFQGKPAAGICYFKLNDRVLSSFYLTQTKYGRENHCLTLLIVEGLKRAKEQNYKWFDFGTSSINMKARENIFLFKESFSLLGVFRQSLTWQKDIYNDHSTNNHD